MKVLILSQHFWPESFRINDLATKLHDRGHEVTIFTGRPNYPAGKYFPGYSFFGPSREQYNGMEVVRMPLPPRGNNSPVRLAFNFLWFATVGAIVAPLRLRNRYDAILVFASSPVLQAFPALVLQWLGRGRVLLWLQDLWPESLAAAGALQSRWILAIMRSITSFLHRHSTLNLVQSHAFAASLEKLGVDPRTIRYFPNSAEDLYRPLKPGAEDGEMPRGFRVVFAGNIGQAQDFPTILDAAERLKPHSTIQWVIYGDGRARAWVEDQIQCRGLDGCVHLMGRRPVEDMPGIFAAADVLLVTLRKQPIFALTVPSKMQSYLACAKPIVAALDGEGARIVEEAGCGLAGPAGDAAALASNILRMAESTPDARADMGRQGYRYFEDHFDSHKLLPQLEQWMEQQA